MSREPSPHHGPLALFALTAVLLGPLVPSLATAEPSPPSEVPSEVPASEVPPVSGEVRKLPSEVLPSEVPPVSGEVPSDSPSSLTAEAVASLLDDWVPEAMQEADIPGAAVAVVQGGEVLLTRGYGLADVEEGVEVDPELTVFRMGSVSKPLTASAILSLLERVDFDLDRDVRPLVDELPLAPDWEAPLTLRQLLTHTGGFNESLIGQHAADPGSWRPLGDFLARRLPPRFAPPGEVIGYSDFNTSLAGYVAERLAGTSFQELTEQLVFEPLGMRSSTFRQVDPPQAVAANRAKSYRRAGGRLEAYPVDYLHTTPGVGLWSTAADMAKYLGALSSDGGELGAAVMSAASWREQKTVHQRHHARLQGKALGLTEVRRAGRSMLYKDGQSSGFHARFLLVPDQNLAIFSCHNRTILGRMGAINAAGRFNRSLGWKIVDELLPEVERAIPPAPSPAPGAAGRLAAYEGVYRTTIAARHTAEKLIAMMDDVEVERSGEEGGLTLGGGPFVEVEPGLFQWHEGGSFFAAFAPAVGGASPYLYLGAGAYERIPFYESSRITVRLAGAFVALFAFGAGWFAWKTRSLGRAGAPAPVRQAAASALALSGLNWLFLAAFGAALALTDVQYLMQGWPWTARAALALPILALLPLALLVWRLSHRAERAGLGRGARSWRFSSPPGPSPSSGG